MKETAHIINQQLVGIYTERQRNQGDDGLHVKKLPTIVFLNSGFLHHVGPYRLYVRLARYFAKQGFSSFRFDLSGIGDSDIHRDNRSYQEQYKGDIKEALDFLESEMGDKEFIVLGICTGADNAHKSMVDDFRVKGVVAIDGYTYPTSRYYWNEYFPKMTSLKSWSTLLKMSLSKVMNIKKNIARRKSCPPRDIDLSWNRPPKETLEKEYLEFINRNANLLCIYTASWAYNYKEQLSDVFAKVPFGGNIQTVYLEDAEHIFPLVEGRQALTQVIMDWLEDRFILI